MPARFHGGVERGWDVIYNPDVKVGRVQHTADPAARPVRFTTDGTAMILPAGHGVPGRVVRGLRKWIAAGAPGVDLPDPR